MISLCGGGGAGGGGYKTTVLRHFSYFAEYILADPDPVFPIQHQVEYPSLEYANCCDC